jgi:hypothetical protein
LILKINHHLRMSYLFNSILHYFFKRDNVLDELLSLLKLLTPIFPLIF